MYALFYSDTGEFIAAPAKGSQAMALAQTMSRELGREVLVVFNGADGETELWARSNLGQMEIIGSRRRDGLHRWLKNFFAGRSEHSIMPSRAAH